MKKILLIILTFLASTSVVFGATNLWQFYNEQGLLLPSYEYRKDFYEQILAEDEYKGTVKQNDLYLQYLQGNDFVPAPKAEEIKLGASLPSATAVFETSLASPITSSATSLTLTANSVRGGGSLSGYNCFTIDEGATTAETVCGTVSSTAVSSLTRGISQANGTTTVSALQFAHRRGSNVKITDFPIIQILKAQNNGEDTFANVLHYATTTGSCLDGSDICNKSYIDATANAGAATSTETNGGIVELGTLAEQADSYDGGSSKPTVLQTKNSTSTCQVVGSYNIVASSTTGSWTRIVLTVLSYAFSGTKHSGVNSFSNSVGIGTTSPFTSLLSGGDNND